MLKCAEFVLESTCSLKNWLIGSPRIYEKTPISGFSHRSIRIPLLQSRHRKMAQ